MDKRKEAWLRLSLVPGVGVSKIQKLVSVFKDPINVFKSDAKTLRQIKGLNDEIIDFILNKEDELKKVFDKEIELIQKHDIKLYMLYEKDYPASLKNIYNPPPVLYMKGELRKEDMVSIAIVGSRYPTYYGRKIASELARALAVCGITIISGLARGIDYEAHKAALSEGRTIAVLGNGLGMHYPAENKGLAESIYEKGAVLSEFPVLARPDRKNFPLRNRIISGLSLGVLVVEASTKSGSLITARWGLEQGKDIFAVPGEITNPRTEGPHKLIKDGAKIVTCAEDILEEIAVARDLFYAQETKPSSRGFKKRELSESERMIYEVIEKEGKVNIERLIAALSIEAKDLFSILGSLEIKGFIKKLPGKIYCNLI